MWVDKDVQDMLVFIIAPFIQVFVVPFVGVRRGGWFLFSLTVLCVSPCPASSSIRKQGSPALMGRWKTSSSSSSSLPAEHLSPRCWLHHRLWHLQMESLLGALRYYLQRWQGSHPGKEVPHLLSAPTPSSFLLLLLDLSLLSISVVTSCPPTPSPALCLCDSSDEQALGLVKKHMTSNVWALLLIYSNGSYGISTVNSIQGTELIFNTVVKELQAHADVFQTTADFHFLNACFPDALKRLKFTQSWSWPPK